MESGALGSQLRRLCLARRSAMLATTILILLGAGYLFWVTTKMQPPLLKGYPGDAFYPRIALALVAAFAILVVVKEAMKPKQGEMSRLGEGEIITFDLLETLTIALLILGFVFGMEAFGFEIATSVFMFILLLPRLMMPWSRAIPMAAFMAVLTMLVIYACFVIGLKVFMPMRFLPAYVNF